MLTWKKLKANEFEATGEKHDFHLRKESGSWALEIFDSAIQDPNAAHVGGEMFESKEEAQEYAEKYK